MELNRKLLFYTLTLIFISLQVPELETTQNNSTNCEFSVSNSSNCASLAHLNQQKDGIYETQYLTPKPGPGEPTKKEKGDTDPMIKPESYASQLARGVLNIKPFPVFQFIKSFIQKPNVKYQPLRLKVKVPKVSKPIFYLTNDGVTTQSTNGNLQISVETTAGTTEISTLFPTFDEEQYHENKYTAYAKYYGLHGKGGGWSGWQKKKHHPGKGKGKKKGHGKKYHKKKNGHGKYKAKAKGHHQTDYGWGWTKKSHKSKGHHKKSHKNKGHYEESEEIDYGWGWSNKGGKSKGHHKKGYKKVHKNQDYGYETTMGYNSYGQTDYGWGHNKKGHHKKGHNGGQKNCQKNCQKKGGGKKGGKKGGKGQKKGKYPKFYDSLGNSFPYAGYGKSKTGKYHQKAFQKGKGSDPYAPIYPIPVYREGEKGKGGKNAQKGLIPIPYYRQDSKQ